MATVDYNHINQLAALAKQGNEQARDELLHLSYPWVDQVIARHGLWPPRGTGLDDMIQAGVIGVYQSLRLWNPSRWFVAYTEPIIYRRVVNLLRAAGRLKHQPLSDACSLDAPVESMDRHPDREPNRLAMWEMVDSSGLGNDPLEVILEHEEAGRVEQLFGQIRGVLSPTERAALERIILGEEPYLQVATDIKTSPKAIDNAVQRVKGKAALLLLEQPSEDWESRLIHRLETAARRVTRKRTSA